MTALLLDEIKGFIIHGVMSLPRTKLSTRLKVVLLRAQGMSVGSGLALYEDVWISNPHLVKVGDNVDLAKGVVITGAGGVTIDDRVMIGYQTSLLSGNHRIPPHRDPIYGAGHELAPIHVHKDVWIGANCVILPGVTIGEGAVVAAGSVVNRDVEPFAIVGGVPATVLKMRE